MPRTSEGLAKSTLIMAMGGKANPLQRRRLFAVADMQLGIGPLPVDAAALCLATLQDPDKTAAVTVEGGCKRA